MRHTRAGHPPSFLHMRSLSSRLPPLQAYVTGVIILGALCCAVVFVRDGSSLSRLLTPEVMLFAVCAFAGELISLKVVTRGAEGEVTTSTTFAFAALLVAGPADSPLPWVALLFLPLLAVHRGGRQAIAKEHQAVHDALTGLPNRSLFRHQIEQVVNAGRRTDHTAAVMLIPDLPSHEGASAVAQRLLAQLREPFEIEGLTLEVDASIGIACAPEHGSAVEQPLHRADIP